MFAIYCKLFLISKKVCSTYSARHTYSDKLKQAAGDKKDKAALIGHTDYDFTQHRYQSSSLEDLAKVVDPIK